MKTLPLVAVSVIVLGLLTSCTAQLVDRTGRNNIPYPYQGSGIIECIYSDTAYYFDAKNRYSHITVWNNGMQVIDFEDLRMHHMESVRLTNPNYVLQDTRCRELGVNERIPDINDFPR